MHEDQIDVSKRCPFIQEFSRIIITPYQVYHRQTSPEAIQLFFAETILHDKNAILNTKICKTYIKQFLCGVKHQSNVDLFTSKFKFITSCFSVTSGLWEIPARQTCEAFHANLSL